MNRAGFVLCVLLGFAPVAAIADPIPNSSFADRSAGWFDAKGLACPQVCERKNAVAESEKNTAPPASMSYVCKVRKAGQGPYLWLFGTQFASRPACYTTDRNLEGEYSDVFYCLCVEPRARRLREPDPGAILREAPARGAGGVRIDRRTVDPSPKEVPR